MIEDRAKSPLKRKKTLGASLAIVATTAAAWFVRDSVPYERTNDPQIDGHIMPVSARINGQVEQVNVIVGQVVHAGDVLAIMDQREYSIAVYQAMECRICREHRGGLVFQCGDHHYQCLQWF